MGTALHGRCGGPLLPIGPAADDIRVPAIAATDMPGSRVTRRTRQRIDFERYDDRTVVPRLRLSHHRIYPRVAGADAESEGNLWQQVDSLANELS